MTILPTSKYRSRKGSNNNQESNVRMNESKSVTKDPICGMTVDEATALHAERDGKTFYFCCDHCRQKFLSTPAGAKSEGKSGCCGG
ncbi:MAG: YHS domain-containing protein [Spartobacteria bacterium]